jgi:hypothetical protein
MAVAASTHIAFAANNYDELIASFNRHGVKYRATQCRQ